MITIVMVKQPKDFGKHIWSINPEVFPIIHEASKRWPGVIAYRLIGQEKYYEPIPVALRAEDTQLGAVPLATNIEPLMAAEDTEVKTPDPHAYLLSPEPAERKPLTFIDLKTRE